jgi:beta-lactamase regulating signal transducer with metallopeptidase domain
MTCFFKKCCLLFRNKLFRYVCESAQISQTGKQSAEKRGNMQVVEWTRAELKNVAKAAMKVNYWGMVLVGLILAYICSPSGSSTSSKHNTLKSFRQPKKIMDDSTYIHTIRRLKDWMQGISSTTLLIVLIALIIAVLIFVFVGILLISVC